MPKDYIIDSYESMIDDGSTSNHFYFYYTQNMALDILLPRTYLFPNFKSDPLFLMKLNNNLKKWKMNRIKNNK